MQPTKILSLLIIPVNIYFATVKELKLKPIDAYIMAEK